MREEKAAVFSTPVVFEMSAAAARGIFGKSYLAHCD